MIHDGKDHDGHSAFGCPDCIENAREAEIMNINNIFEEFNKQLDTIKDELETGLKNLFDDTIVTHEKAVAAAQADVVGNRELRASLYAETKKVEALEARLKEALAANESLQGQLVELLDMNETLLKTGT